MSKLVLSEVISERVTIGKLLTKPLLPLHRI